MIKCNLRKICFEKDIRSVSELERIIGLTRPTLYKMFNNDNIDSVKMGSFDMVCKKLHIKNLSELIEFVEDTTDKVEEK